MDEVHWVRDGDTSLRLSYPSHLFYGLQLMGKVFWTPGAESVAPGWRWRLIDPVAEMSSDGAFETAAEAIAAADAVAIPIIEKFAAQKAAAALELDSLNLADSRPWAGTVPTSGGGPARATEPAGDARPDGDCAMTPDNDSSSRNRRQAIGGLRAGVRRRLKGRRRSGERPAQGAAEIAARRKRKSDLLFYAAIAIGVLIIVQIYVIIALISVRLDGG